jgi:ech hydrogenase subunit E
VGANTLIPFGPQHPVLPEPIHLDLELEDETVVSAIPSLGFVHRGLEKLVEKKDFREYVYIAERICGICSFIHGMGYCQSIEEGMGIAVPERAEFLRVFWSELSRVHSHVMWLGLLGDALGFESIFMHCWRIREKVLDIFDMTTGGRVIFSVCDIGGSRRDISPDTLKRANSILIEASDELAEVTEAFMRDSSVRHRTEGLGKLSKEDAHRLGAVGPVAKASGIALDMRSSGYSAYKHLSFSPVIDSRGDCYARNFVRIKEIFQSIKLIEQCIELMPQGPIMADFKGFPTKESFVRLEQPRGEVVYYTKGNGTKFLSRMRVRTPTFANLPALLSMLPGALLSDVPVLVLTIDPCVSCSER